MVLECVTQMTSLCLMQLLEKVVVGLCLDVVWKLKIPLCALCFWQHLSKFNSWSQTLFLEIWASVFFLFVDQVGFGAMINPCFGDGNTNQWHFDSRKFFGFVFMFNMAAYAVVFINFVFSSCSHFNKTSLSRQVLTNSARVTVPSTLCCLRLQMS